MKLRDAELVGTDITVIREGDRFYVWTPHDLLVVTEEELLRFAMSILDELGASPVTEKWAERG